MSNKSDKPSFKERAKNTWGEFKKFIARGNVLDMAIGVIIGSAFGAIVTAVTNILLSVCTWGVPGGLSGLVTVLPAVSASQTGYESITIGGEALRAYYSAAEWAQLSMADDFTSVISGMYTLHGGTYYYNGLALIDWGALINAVISFLIIAITLFVILKVYTALKTSRQRLAAEAKAKIEAAKAENGTEVAATEQTPEQK